VTGELTPNYRLDPLDRGVIGKLTRRQLTVLGVAALLWLLLSVSGQGMVKPAALFAVAALVAVPPFAGQPIIDWMPLWAGWGMRGRWHRRWSRPLHLTTATVPAAQPVLPPWLGGLRLEAHPTDGWAAIHDQASKTLTAHLHLAGTGFSTLAPDQMERLLDGWGAVFAAFDGLRRITWTDIARPMPLVGHSEWIDGQPSTSTDIDEYRAFVADQQPIRHDLIAAVTLDVGTMRGEAAQRDALTRMHSAIEIVNDALREAHMRAVGPLPAGEISYLLRSGLDPTSVDPAGGVRPDSLVQRLGLVPAPAAGPMSTTVSARHVEVDAVCHRSYWIESWPEVPQSADWFDTVLGQQDLDGLTQRLVTVIVEPVDDDKALAELRSAAARHGGEQEAARQGRARWDPFKARRASAVSARESEVANGATAVGYAGLVVVTVAGGADDSARMQRCSKAVERRFRNRRVLLRPLWGRMELGLAAALPLGLGLSREPF
jgi:hypothetical protein